MSIVVSQPMYIPWPGLFDQIKHADVFVHFDDVHIPQGRSFISRVQLKTPQQSKWLSVPLVRSTRGLIKDVRIDFSLAWKEKHQLQIKEQLKHTPFFEDVELLIDRVLGQDFLYLSDLNIAWIETISNYLGFKPKFLKSSSLKVKGSSSKKLLEIVQQLNGTTYITGHGASNYLDHKLFETSDISVKYIKYNIVSYNQSHGPFTPYVTILDLIAHKGKDAAKHLKSELIDWKEFLNE